MSKLDEIGPLMKDEYENTPTDLKTIAKKYNVGYNTARDWRNTQGWVKKVQKDPLDCLSVSKEVALQVKDDWENTSMTIQEISKKYNINHNTIQPWIKKFNWIKKEEAQREYKKKLDQRSRQIVQDETYYRAKDLYENTSIPVTEIAKQTGLTIDMIWNRVKYDKWYRSDELKSKLQSEKFKQIYRNMNSETKQRQRQKMSEANRRTWKCRQPEKTATIVQHRLETLSNKSEEELQKTRNKISKSVSQNYKNNPKLIKTLSNKGKQRWQNKSEEEKECFRETMKQSWKNKTEEELQEWSNKRKQTYANMSTTYKRKIWLKGHETAKQNNRYGKSQLEDTLYTYLVNEFGEENVIRQFVQGNYSFDFKITRPSLNPQHKGQLIEQLIELNGVFYHNYRPYKDYSEHQIEYEQLCKKGPMYKSIADKWKHNDIEKYLYCKSNKLNYMALYVSKTPEPYFSKTELENSYKSICKSTPKYTNISRNNEIVNEYCYKQIYKDNLSKLKDEQILMNYLINRIKYANNYGESCGYITQMDLIRDFNKSNITITGFTMHPINNIRKFIIDYNIKSIADPFAGWGHRMIGAYSMNCNYIGCDINTIQCQNLTGIKQFLNTQNSLFRPTIQIINKDSSTVDVSTYNYDAIFTCPPYWNTEIYTDKGVENLDYKHYRMKLKEILLHWITPNVKVIGIQFTEKYEDCIDELGFKYEKITLNQGVHHFNKTNKKFNECIYIIKL